MTEHNYRHELKYLISHGQFEILKNRLSGLISTDPYSIGGKYNVRSVYFDDYENRCYYENLNGTEPREKFRLRIYNHNPGRIALECKRKEHGLVEKTDCLITKEQCDSLICGEIPVIQNESPLLMKLALEMKTRRLHPVIVVEYDRIPFVYKSGNVRITFDTNISSSYKTDSFLTPQIPRRPIMPVGMQLLEVKYGEYLPEFIYNAVQTDTLEHTSYSKYFLARKYSL